jgi:hypothetical protein
VAELRPSFWVSYKTCDWRGVCPGPLLAVVGRSFSGSSWCFLLVEGGQGGVVGDGVVSVGYQDGDGGESGGERTDQG